MKTIGKLFAIGLIVAVIGFILKMTLIPGGGLTLILSLSFLSVVSFIQFISSLNKIKDNKIIKVMSAFMSLTLSIAFIYILFKYQWYPGGFYYFMIGIFPFIILTILLIVEIKTMLREDYRKYVIRNLLIPWIFIFVFGALPNIMSAETFYNTFSYRRQEMTYQQFLDNVVFKDKKQQSK